MRPLVQSVLRIGLLVSMLLLPMVTAAPAALADSSLAAATQIQIVPDSAVSLVGGRVTMDVRIGHVGYLSGYQFGLLFDPGILQVVDVDLQLGGVQISQGDVFAGMQPFVTNHVNNATGEITFSNTLVGAGAFVTIPAPNTKSLATITFDVVGSGTSLLEFDPSEAVTYLSDRSAMPIEADWIDGAVEGVVATDRLFVPLVASNWR